MARPASRSSHTQVLRPRARLLRTLGDELISSETVAIIELVKNAYDADATRVLVRFREPLEIGRGGIEVIDNGHGMSPQTIQTVWMEPATLVRKRKSRSEERGRRVLGEKGIGRFAAARLTEALEVVTRRGQANREVRVFFDWSQFDDERKYLDEIKIPWEEVKPTDICPGGAIQTLWEPRERPKTNDLGHGTILRMDRLRARWDESLFVSLRTGLARLISPFLAQGQLAGKDQFQIRLELPTEYDHISGIVEPPEAVKSPHYTSKGYVDEAGQCDLTLTLRGRKGRQPVEGQPALPSGRRQECGPFRIEVRVWDRDQASMSELAHEYGSTVADVRRDLDDAAGINIYRDGFRVLPYGEPRNDWLRLDLRRVQNPTLRLSNNQIVGYVLISADENPNLRDQTNREGLMEGQALNDLRYLVTAVLAELETRRYTLRPRREKSTRRAGGIFADFDLAEVRDTVERRHPDDADLLAVVRETEQDLERRVEQVQEVLARYRRLATLGQLIDTILHDGRAPLSKIRRESDLGLRDVERALKKADKAIKKLGGRFGVIGTQSDVLATVFRKIEPFGGRKRGRAVAVRLEQVIADAFSVLDTEIAEVGARVSLPTTDTEVTMDQAEVQEVIINLLLNSLYWLRRVPQDSRQIAVRVRRITPSEVEILFSDSGPGVESEFRERIFEPYFSTKPDGVGLGLTIAGEIVTEYYGGELELLAGGPLSGASFRITLRRRVQDG